MQAGLGIQHASMFTDEEVQQEHHPQRDVWIAVQRWMHLGEQDHQQGDEIQGCFREFICRDNFTIVQQNC